MKQGRNLVVVRCGDNSLHPGWCEPGRTWDLAVSYFGSDADKLFPEADYVHHFKGGKWDGIAAFFAANPNCLDHYDRFWLPDDDIAADRAGIDRLFDMARGLDLELAQPSLSQDSYLSHLVSLHNPFFSYRRITLVEIMVPLLDRTLLQRVLPLFAATRSGFGLDFVWHRLTSDPTRRVGIIDAVQVTHTRPVGGPLRAMIATAAGETAEQEQERFLARYGEVVKTEIVLGGQLACGPRVGSPKLAATLAALGWATRPVGNRGFRQILSAPRFLVWVARNWWGNMAGVRPAAVLPLEVEHATGAPVLIRAESVAP